MTEYTPISFGAPVPEGTPKPPDGQDELPEEITSLPEGTVVLTVTFTRENRNGVNGLNVDWDPGKNADDESYIDPMLGVRLIREAADALEQMITPYAMILEWLKGKVKD